MSSETQIELNGWKPPVVYDIGLDKYRIATQQDLDNYAALAQAYGRVRTTLKEIEQIHAALIAATGGAEKK